MPGGYMLELGLLSVSSGRFSDQGVAPVLIPVMVPTWTPETLHQYLNTPLGASAVAPALSVTVDRAHYRAGDDLRVSIELAVMERPVFIDAYLALFRPDGHVDFLAKDQLVSITGGLMPTASRAYIHKRSRISSAIGLRLGHELPPGDYTIYVFITEASSYRRLAKASARFRVEP
jgi:hypothetical protein